MPRPAPGKSPGAFAHPTVPSVHPYVLLNYMGKPRDVMTLAHELGHGVHQVLAGDQGALMASTPLTLAETASVFGEMLTFRSLLEKTRDKRERKAMLAQKAEDMINTVVRQIAFYQFERRVHTERDERRTDLRPHRRNLAGCAEGEPGTDAVRFGPGYETFWTYIPHFIHSPFYVYAYAFGDCLVNSLYAVYQNADAGFQQKYFDMLKAGGTKHHSELLAPFRPRRDRPCLLAKGPVGHRRHHRRAGGDGRRIMDTTANSAPVAPAHTPYDGSAQPFTIGLQQLDPKDWIEIDGDLLGYLAEKERLFALNTATGSSSRKRAREEAQREVAATFSADASRRALSIDLHSYRRRHRHLPAGMNPRRLAIRMFPSCIAPRALFRKTSC